MSLDLGGEGTKAGRYDAMQVMQAMRFSVYKAGRYDVRQVMEEGWEI